MGPGSHCQVVHFARRNAGFVLSGAAPPRGLGTALLPLPARDCLSAPSWLRRQDCGSVCRTPRLLCGDPFTVRGFSTRSMYWGPRRAGPRRRSALVPRLSTVQPRSGQVPGNEPTVCASRTARFTRRLSGPVSLRHVYRKPCGHMSLGFGAQRLHLAVCAPGRQSPAGPVTGLWTQRLPSHPFSQDKGLRNHAGG